MSDTNVIVLTTCDKCKRKLQTLPGYPNDVAMTCTHCGDYFIQRLNGKPDAVVFRPFPKDDVKLSVKKKRAGRSVVVKAPPAAKRRPGNPGVPVICDQTGEVFATVEQAAARFNVVAPNIFHVLRGSRPHSGGYTFTRLGDIDPDVPFVTRAKLPLYRRRSDIPIRCDQTGVMFDSIKDATDAMGLSQGSVSKQLKGRISHIKGYTFTSMIDIDSNEPFTPRPIVKRGGKIPYVPIRCVETGVEFPSISSASTRMRIPRTTLYAHLQDNITTPKVKGYTFVFMEEYKRVRR